MPVANATQAGITDSGYRSASRYRYQSYSRQTGAAAPFGPIDLADCDFHQPRRRGQRADCHERYCRCLPQGRLDFVRHQNSQAKADGCAGHDEERIKRKLFGSF